MSSAGSFGDAALLIAALRGAGMSLATAESLTGGLVAASVTAVPGASDVFLGGVIAYATATKHRVLGVPADELQAHGPVAAQTAEAMALAACGRFGADLGLATTGVAGPDPVGDHQPGVVFVAAALGSGLARVVRLDCDGDRAAVRACAVRGALSVGLELLQVGNAPRE